MGAFTLATEHPAFRLEGYEVTLEPGNSLSFQFNRAGRAMVVLRTDAPLQVAEQHGLTARLRPGWDGTLGYSLYALEIEASKAGAGRVLLAIVPVPTETINFFATFSARPSRFPDEFTAFHNWQIEYRARLAASLMDGGLPSRVPLTAEILEIEEHAAFTLRRVRYRTREDRENTLLLALPKNAIAPAPLLVALHGHEATWGEADAGAFTPGHADDFCAYFAERGWAVVQPATMHHTLQHAGWTLQGEWTWDAMIALDFATELPEVDATRVATCGLSTGAHLVMNLLALDNRVRAGVVGCILSTWQHYRKRLRIPPHCDCGIIDQLGDWLEPCDWAALAAPKPVQFHHGRQDAAFCPGANPALLQPGWNTAVMPEKEFAAAFAEVERAYQQESASGNVQLHFHDDGHRVDNSGAYAFLMGRAFRVVK